MDRTRREATAAEWGVGRRQKAESRKQKAESRKQKAEALGYARAFSSWDDSNWNKLFCTTDLYSVDGVLYESEHNQRFSEFPRLWIVAIGSAGGDLGGRLSVEQFCYGWSCFGVYRNVSRTSAG